MAGGANEADGAQQQQQQQQEEEEGSTVAGDGAAGEGAGDGGEGQGEGAGALAGGPSAEPKATPLPTTVAQARKLALEPDAVTRYAVFHDVGAAEGAEAAATSGGEGVDGKDSSTHNKAEPGSGAEAGRGAPEAEPLGALSFVEVLCRSRALEVLAASYIRTPSSSEHESADLAALLRAALRPPAASHAAEIADEVKALAEAAGELDSEELVSIAELLALAADALGALKLDVARQRGADRLRGAREELQALVADGAKAAVSANAADGAADDEGVDAAPNAAAESSSLSPLPQRVSALTTAAALLKASSAARGAAQAARAPCVVAAGRGAQRLARAEELVDTLSSDVAQLQAALAGCEAQQKESGEYQATRLKEMGSREQSAAADVASLSKARDELAAELLDVEARLSEAEARHTKLAEEHAEFDRSNAEMRAELEARNAALAQSVRSHSAELAAAELWRGFLGSAEERAGSCRLEAEEESEVLAGEARAAAAAAAAFGAERCREELVLALRRLEFCRDELANSTAKQADARELGMAAVVEEMRAGRRALEHNYLECEQEVHALVHVGRSVVRQHELTAAALAPAIDAHAQSGAGGGAPARLTSPPAVNRHDEAVKIALEGITALEAQFEAADKPELTAVADATASYTPGEIVMAPAEELEPLADEEVAEASEANAAPAALAEDEPLLDEAAQQGGENNTSVAGEQDITFGASGDAEETDAPDTRAVGVEAEPTAPGVASGQGDAGAEEVGVQQEPPSTPAADATTDDVPASGAEPARAPDTCTPEAALSPTGQGADALLEAEADEWLADESDGDAEDGDGDAEDDAVGDELQRAAAELAAALDSGDDEGERDEGEAGGEEDADADDADGSSAAASAPQSAAAGAGGSKKRKKKKRKN